MNVTFNPSVNFKSEGNLIAEAARKIQQEQNQPKVIHRPDISELSSPVRYPDSWVPREEREQKNAESIEKNLANLEQALNDGKNIDTILKSKHWEKIYNPESNTIHAKIPNSHDGNEYTVYPDGKVVVTNGWGKNEVEREANRELAEYVKEMKSAYENEKQAEVEPKSNAYTSIEYTQAELDEKANIFKERLNSRKWGKEYLPENDIIMIRPKRLKDGLEYMIKNDGTVLETGLRQKATVIIEPNSESAKTFAKYKRKLDPNAPKKSLWEKGKEAVADVWKFFSVAGTMSVAAAKGLWQGLLTGAAVLGAVTILRGASAVIKNQKTIADVIKAPLKTAGMPGKVLSIIAGGLVLTGHLIAGRMKANQNSAVIEHKIDVPHEND